MTNVLKYVCMAVGWFVFDDSLVGWLSLAHPLSFLSLVILLQWYMIFLQSNSRGSSRQTLWCFGNAQFWFPFRTFRNDVTADIQYTHQGTQLSLMGMDREARTTQDQHYRWLASGLRLYCASCVRELLCLGSIVLGNSGPSLK